MFALNIMKILISTTSFFMSPRIFHALNFTSQNITKGFISTDDITTYVSFSEQLTQIQIQNIFILSSAEYLHFCALLKYGMNISTVQYALGIKIIHEKNSCMS
jgi:hypothetical protein